MVVRTVIPSVNNLLTPCLDCPVASPSPIERSGQCGGGADNLMFSALRHSN